MARNDSPPFPRGTYESSGDYDHMLGREWEVEDLDHSQTSGATKHRSGEMVRIRLVKNSSGFALLPKRLAAFSTTAGENGRIVKGYSITTNGVAYPVDEFLPAAGVPDGAYFYIVTRGPAAVLIGLSSAENNADIAVGAPLAAISGATSGATTAGRLGSLSVTGSSQATEYATILTAALNSVGRAISSALSNATTGTNSILVHVGKW